MTEDNMREFRSGVRSIQRAVLEEAALVADRAAERYPEDVWPDPPEGGWLLMDGVSDRIAATMGRLVAREIARGIRELIEEEEFV